MIAINMRMSREYYTDPADPEQIKHPKLIGTVHSYQIPTEKNRKLPVGYKNSKVSEDLLQGIRLAPYQQTAIENAFADRWQNRVLITDDNIIVFQPNGRALVNYGRAARSWLLRPMRSGEWIGLFPGEWYIMNGKLVMALMDQGNDLALTVFNYAEEDDTLRLDGVPYKECKFLACKGRTAEWR